MRMIRLHRQQQNDLPRTSSVISRPALDGDGGGGGGA